MAIIDEYLVRLGFTIDHPGYARFEAALKDAAHMVENRAGGMAGAFIGAQSAIVSGFAAIGAAAVGLVDKVAMADQDFRLYAMHMFMGKEQARSLKIALDALGTTLANATWDAELRERTHQLIADQRVMAQNLGEDFDEQMRKARDIRFEFTRMGVELQYLGMSVAKDFMEALGLGPDELLEKLRKFNRWVQDEMPALSKKIVKEFMPVWEDIKDVAIATWHALKGFAAVFTSVVGLLTGDTSLTGTTFSLEKMLKAVHDITHAFAIFAETIAQIEDLLAHLINAVTLVASGKFKEAGDELAAAWKDVNLRTILMVTGAGVGAYFGGPMGAMAGTGAATWAANMAEKWGVSSPPEFKDDLITGATGPWTTIEGKPAETIKPPDVPISGGAPKAMDIEKAPPSIAKAQLMAYNIQGIAARAGIRPELLYATMMAESSGNPNIKDVWAKGVPHMGLMMLSPNIAQHYGVNPRDPNSNLYGGARYLHDLQQKYGSEAAAVAAYNMGETNMNRFLAGKMGMPDESRNEVQKVMAMLGQTGTVQIGSLTINVGGTAATPAQIQKAATQGIKDAADARVQRNLHEFQHLSYSY